MPDKKYVKFAGRMVMVGFGSIGQGVLPLILRHIDIDAGARSPSSPPRSAATTRPRASASASSTAADPRAITRACSSRCSARATSCSTSRSRCRALALVELCHEQGRALSRHLHRAVARRLHRSVAVAVARAPTTRCARACWRCARSIRGGADRGDHPRRQSRPGLAFRQAGAARRRRDTGAGADRAARTARAGRALARKLGVKVIHIAERDTQVSTQPKTRRRVRQHLVDRRLRLRGRAAGRAGLGHAREALPARRRAPRFRLRRRDLSQPARRLRRACAPGRRSKGPYHGFLITHSESISIADYFTVREGGAGASTARPCTTPTTRATTRCCRCTSSPARTGTCRRASA